MQLLLGELPPDQIFDRLGPEFRVQPLTFVIAWLNELVGITRLTSYRK